MSLLSSADTSVSISRIFSGSTPNSVGVRLYRLREKLRHYLTKEGLLV